MTWASMWRMGFKGEPEGTETLQEASANTQAREDMMAWTRDGVDGGQKTGTFKKYDFAKYTSINPLCCAHKLIKCYMSIVSQ